MEMHSLTWAFTAARGPSLVLASSASPTRSGRSTAPTMASAVAWTPSHDVVLCDAYLCTGGNLQKVVLGKWLGVDPKVLVLDEPTNDLDVDTLRSLEEALLEFGGCSLVISHDRWFLDKICTQILAFEGDSHVEFFQGNFQYYEIDRKRRCGEEASKPRRIKYRRLAS